MELTARLVHAEAGRRVVRVTAWQGERRLGSALGEAADAEQAEDRATARLLARFGGEPHQERPRPQPAAASPTRPSGAARAASPVRAAPPAPADSGPTPPPEREPAAPAPGPEPPPAAGDRPEPAGEPPGAAAEPPAAAAEPPLDPEDWSDELARLELQLQRIGWNREQEGLYLQRAFGHPSRSRLTRWVDLTAFLRALEGFEAGADPATAPTPLRRSDLLEQCDGLLERLGWDTGQARRFLERHWSVASRQQLGDDQLLRFNMQLEEAWLSEGAPGPPCEPGAVSPTPTTDLRP